MAAKLDMRRKNHSDIIAVLGKKYLDKGLDKGQIFEKMITRHSAKKDFEDAVDEWSWFMVFRDDTETFCVCSHQKIVFQFLIWNRYTGNILRLGSECINPFIDKATLGKIRRQRDDFAIYRCPICRQSGHPFSKHHPVCQVCCTYEDPATEVAEIDFEDTDDQALARVADSDDDEIDCGGLLAEDSEPESEDESEPETDPESEDISSEEELNEPSSGEEFVPSSSSSEEESDSEPEIISLKEFEAGKNKRIIQSMPKRVEVSRFLPAPSPPKPRPLPSSTPKPALRSFSPAPSKRDFQSITPDISEFEKVSQVLSQDMDQLLSKRACHIRYASEPRPLRNDIWPTYVPSPRS